jgi:hypothetical protein
MANGHDWVPGRGSLGALSLGPACALDTEAGACRSLVAPTENDVQTWSCYTSALPLSPVTSAARRA